MMHPFTIEGKTGEGVEVFGRRGTTAYEIEISQDGCYFHIYQITQVEGDGFSVRKCVHESGAPFATEDATIEAAKLWIERKH